jgi:hypothetical protein
MVVCPPIQGGGFMFKSISYILFGIFSFSCAAFSSQIDTTRSVYYSEVTHPDVLKLNEKTRYNKTKLEEIELKTPIRLSKEDVPDLIALKICQDSEPGYKSTAGYKVLTVSLFARNKAREYHTMLSVSCIQEQLEKLK